MAKGKNNYQEYNGLKFRNETEVEFYKMCEQAIIDGRIKSFKYEVEYELFPKFQDWRAYDVDSINHTPDFLITLTNGCKIVVDTKGGGSLTHDKVSLLKRKIWMYNNQNTPYYMISKSPAFLGNFWIETSSGHDFMTKLKSLYKKLYPHENVRQWRTCKKFLPEDWANYFEYEYHLDLFYVMLKKYTKKEIQTIGM